MLRRTIKLRQIEATGIGMENGEVKTVKLRNFIYTGRKMSRGAVEKEFKADMEDANVTQLVYQETEVEKTYEVSIEKFLEVAEEVTENGEEI